MNARHKKFLQDLFEAEVIAALDHIEHGDIVPSNSIVAKTLEINGYVQKRTVNWQGMTITGYVLTDMGRLEYCQICKSSPIDDIPFHNDTCTRCGSELIPGKAIDNTLTGSGDFHDKDEAVTLSVGGTGNLIDCLKCSDDMCGRRFYETGTAFHSEVEG